MIPNIAWPVVIKYNGLDELLFIASQQDWRQTDEVRRAAFRAGDTMIDSVGKVYQLLADGPQPSEQALSLPEVIELVRQHASVCGHCCVSKMGAPSIESAIQWVDEID